MINNNQSVNRRSRRHAQRQLGDQRTGQPTRNIVSQVRNGYSSPSGPRIMIRGQKILR